MQEEKYDDTLVKRIDTIVFLIIFLLMMCMMVWFTAFPLTEIAARNGPSKVERVDIIDRYTDITWSTAFFRFIGKISYDRYNLKLAGADGAEFIRAVSQDLYRDANVSAMPARGAVLEARRSTIFGGKPTMFEFVRYRVGSSEGSEREIVRTYDLSMPLWIGVFLILMSGLMVWGVGSMSKAVKREHSGSEYFNVTPIVYHPRTIKACLLGAMALGVVTWAIRP